MEDTELSVDRMVIDFININWDYFNSLRKRLCEYYNASFYVKEQGFKYRVRLKGNKYWAYLSYQLSYAKPARKHTLRLECHPETIIHFKSWISQLGKQASEIIFVRCDVAFDIPHKLSDVFTMSTKGRKLRLYKGTRYYNKKSQRQKDGYCRVYDKKRELLERKNISNKGELTRMEIVYAPKEKILLQKLIQHPPEFNNRFMCVVLTDISKFNSKVKKFVVDIQKGVLLPQDITYYYRQQIQIQMDIQDVVDLNKLADEQWKEVIILPCEILCEVVSKVAVA